MAADSRKPRGDCAAQPRRLSRRRCNESVRCGPRAARLRDAERDSRQDAPCARASRRTRRRRVLLPPHGGLTLRMSEAEGRHAAGDRRPLQRRHGGRAKRGRWAARSAGGGNGRRAADARTDGQRREDTARRRFSEEHGDLSRPCVRRVGIARGRLITRGMMSSLRSSAFALFQLIVTPFYAVTVFLLAWLPPVARYRYITGWCALNLWAARWICGIRSRVIGSENLQPTPHIVACKHSSTWETLFLSRYLPPLAYVAKKELLSLPFFGWAFRLASPITIDRSAGQDAMAQITEQGRERFALGFWIVLYP